MRTRVIEVTPDIAMEWLARNTHNRPIRQAHINRLVSDMKSGLWKDNGETIKFSKTGVLLDGQHRLWAVVESKTTYRMVVVDELEDDAQLTIDTGAVRTTGNILSLQGIPNANHIAVLARLALRYHRTPNMVWASSSNPTKQEIVEFAMENHHMLGTAVAFGTAARTAIRCPLSAYGSLFFLAATEGKNMRRWESWHTGVVEGVGLEKGDPRLTFRNYHSRRGGHSGRGSWESQMQVAIAIKAWNAYVTNKDIKVLKFMSGELPMPKVR